MERDDAFSIIEKLAAEDSGLRAEERVAINFFLQAIESWKREEEDWAGIGEKLNDVRLYAEKLRRNASRKIRPLTERQIAADILQILGEP